MEREPIEGDPGHCNITGRKTRSKSRAIARSSRWGERIRTWIDQPKIQSVTAVYTEDPAPVAGCLELVVEDLQNQNDYLGRCLHCRREITAQGRGRVEPARSGGLPALWEDRMVMNRPSTISEPQSPSQ